MDRQKYLGIGLILIGLVLLLGFHYNFEGMFTLGVSIAFLIYYWVRGGNKHYRNVGFLIPGVILLYLTGVIMIDNSRSLSYFEDIYSIAGISIAFFLVFILHTYWFTFSSWGKRYWPLIVSGACAVASVIVLFDDYLNIDISEEIFKYIIPVLLIIGGVFVIIRGLKSDKSE